MKKSALLFAAIALMIVASLGIARAQQASTEKVVYVSSSAATYKAMSPTNTGVTEVVISGDPDKGAHRTFSKFPPAYDAGMHYHTNDTSIVVIKGAYIYKDEAGEKRVGPGDFLKVPGGHKHRSGGDKTEGALFYEESDKKFDFVPVK